MKKYLVFLVLSLLVISSVTALAWEPTKEVEFVVHNSPGSGTDFFVRTVAKALQENGIVNQRIRVNNRPGAGGVIARRYLKSQEGNPHVLAGATESWITRGRINPGDYDYTNFTQVAHIIGEPLTVVVRTDSPYDSLQDLIEDMKARPGRVSQGGPSIGSAEWMGGRLLENAENVKINYISFGQGGEVIPQLLGGHVDFIFANPGEIRDYVDAGQLKYLAFATPTRSELFPDVPTFVELGIDIELFGPRGFYAGPNMPEEALDFWADAFEKVMETQEMKDYLARTLNLEIYTAKDDYKDFINKYASTVLPLLEEAGLTKK